MMDKLNIGTALVFLLLVIAVFWLCGPFKKERPAAAAGTAPTAPALAQSRNRKTKHKKNRT